MPLDNLECTKNIQTNDTVDGNSNSNLSKSKWILFATKHYSIL